MRRLATPMFSLVLTGMAAGQAPPHPTSNAEASRSAEKLVKMRMAWGPKMNSPGASLTVKETGRDRTSGGTMVSYRMFAAGLPKDQTYALVTWALNGALETTLEGITLDASGQAVCAGTSPRTCGTPDKPNDPIDLRVFAAKGEPKRIGLVGADRKAKAFATVVPFPIEGRDGSCTLQAMLGLPDAALMIVEGTGFTPGEAVKFDSSSAGESHGGTLKADSQGHLLTVVLPYVQGKSQGETRLQAAGATCSPSLTFHWGRNARHVE